MRSYLLFLYLLLKYRCLCSFANILDLKAHEAALIQFDSRPLNDYWLASALWNQAYANYHVSILEAIVIE